MLLRVLDIPSFWRSRLIKLSYNPLTRVDVRRMFQMGVLSSAEVRRHYLDLGYSEKDAKAMTAWTEIEYAPESRDLTRSDIEDALSRGMLTESEAYGYLRALGYSEESASFYIARVAAKRAEEVQAQQLKAIQSQYEKGIIDEGQARARMAALNLPESQVIANLELWTVNREAKIQRPAVGKLESFYKDSIIGADEFRQEMSAHGYNVAYTGWYLRALDAEKAAEAASEAERARKEQERLAATEVKTAYEEAAANLNLQIALQRQAVAAAQQALNAELSTAELRELEDERAALDTQVAEHKAEIARQREIVSDAKRQLQAKITDAEREKWENILDEVKTEIARLNDEIAAHQTQIASMKEQMLYYTEAESTETAKQFIAAEETAIAELREEITGQKTRQAEAEVALRDKITDVERQRLERQIADAEAIIAERQTAIAELEYQSEQIRQTLTAALTTDVRAELEAAIDAARAEIARLNVEKAQLKIKEE